MYGLLDRDIVYIKKALEHFDEIEKAVVFGSRAMGNYKKGSDVDIAIFGERVNNKVVFELNDYLNEVYPLPYFFDILNYSSISNQNLKNNINHEGKVIFEQRITR